MGKTDQDTAMRRRALQLKIAWLICCAGIAGSILGGILWTETPSDEGRLAQFVLVAGVVLAVAGLGGVLVFRPGKAERKLAATGSYRDRVQREWVAQLAFLPTAMMGLTLVGMVRASEWLSGEDPSLSGVLFAGLAVVNIMLVPAMLMGWDGGSRKLKRLLDDELTRAYRAEALTWAFWMLLIGVAGAYLVGLWNPDAAIVALPLILWVATTTAALKFAALHKRAEREMGDDG